jgi:coenzyme F420-0:L-glutamate ligase/coenzyme F420-1:gamma-L-glutamate ligase
VNSAAAHRNELSRDGAEVERLSSPLAADLDTPGDLKAAMEREQTAATRTPTEGLLALAIDGLGEIQPGDDLPEMIASCVATIAATSAIGGLRSDDVIAVTQKIVSKAEGAIVELTTITPRPEAVEYATKWGRDARQVEVVLQEAIRVVRMDRGVIITETAHGFVLANSGVDASNVGPRSGEVVTLLPRDPDGSARAIREAIRLRTGVAPGVIITDSFGRPWRLGITDVAIGVAGIAALEDLRGKPDADGRMMAATVRAVADQIAATAELALGKTARRPLALIRGAHPQVAEDGSARSSLMPPDWDLFR